MFSAVASVDTVTVSVFLTKVHYNVTVTVFPTKVHYSVTVSVFPTKVHYNVTVTVFPTKVHYKGLKHSAVKCTSCLAFASSPPP